jgi:hypothetical protein
MLLSTNIIFLFFLEFGLVGFDSKKERFLFSLAFLVFFFNSANLIPDSDTALHFEYKKT